MFIAGQKKPRMPIGPSGVFKLFRKACLSNLPKKIFSLGYRYAFDIVTIAIAIAIAIVRSAIVFRRIFRIKGNNIRSMHSRQAHVSRGR